MLKFIQDWFVFSTRRHTLQWASSFPCRCQSTRSTRSISTLSSGKHTKNDGQSPFFNGKINYFDWAMFNSYVSLPEGKPPFSYGFPMVFLWFSYGFPMVFPWGHVVTAQPLPLPRCLRRQQADDGFQALAADGGRGHVPA